MDLMRGWDPEAGLWVQEGPGHCASVASLPRVHSGPEATARLLIAAQTGRLGRLDADAVLSAVHRTQIRDPGPNFGRFYWYAEETTPADDHAVFFNGMSLAVLWHSYRSELPRRSRDILADILRAMQVYAEQRAQARSFFYPNEYLGYLLCAWFPLEFFENPAACERIVPLLREAAEYWRNRHWGWGEHLSDIYGGILLQELSLLLLLAQRLPADVRGGFLRLLTDLVGIEERFGDAPRVPAIRQYAFLQSPAAFHHREHVQPVPEDALAETDPSVSGSRLFTCTAPMRRADGGAWLPLGQTFHELGWHDLVPPASPAAGDFAIPCVDDAAAAVHLEEGLAVGSLTRFPLMPAAEHATWGLSWQCFPVALWRSGGAWGYFQWATLENDVRRAHPARNKYEVYLHNALTETVRPPIVGRTWALQHERNLLVLRVMPAVVSAWQELSDRFRLVGDGLSVVSSSGNGNWVQTVVDLGGRRVALQCVALNGAPTPAWRHEETGVTDWAVTCGKSELAGRECLMTLWGLSLSGEVREPPEITPCADAPPEPGGARLECRWQWPGRSWHVRIDLRRRDAIEEVGPE